MVFLREQGFASIVPLGHSGGGTLFAFYLEQAGLAGADRIATTPGGRPTKLADAAMPMTDGVVFLAPHPGQGRLLLGCIDPSVADETDPLAAVPELDAFDPRNGFAEPPAELVVHAGVPRALPRRPARPGRPHRRAGPRAPGGPHRRGPRGAQAHRRRRGPPSGARPGHHHGVPHRRRPAHGRPLARPQRAPLRLAVRRAARPHQLRAGRVRPARRRRRRGSRRGRG